MLGSKDPAIFLVIFMAGVAILWLNRIIMAFCRSRTCPHCWYCGAAKVTKCKTYRGRDYVALASMMVPMGCQGCLKRFYGLRGVGPVTRQAPATAFSTTRKPRAGGVRVRVQLQIPAYSKPESAQMSKQTAVALPG